MRDFLEYVEKMKDESPTSLEFYLEGFAQDIMHLSKSGIDPVKSFILGFLSGKGINLTENRDKILNLLMNDQDIKNVGQSISSGLSLEKPKKGSLLDQENVNLNSLRKDLASVLVELRKILKDETASKKLN